MKRTRPRMIDCPQCGVVMSLISCGVKAHAYTKRTKNEQTDECNGFVYTHDHNGGIDC